MEIIKSVHEMRELAREWKHDRNNTVAFVPTMGALHKGHGRLIQNAHDHGNIVVVSNFVNPLQFNDPGDLERYPRTPEADIDICRKLNAHFYFSPPAEEMFPAGFLTTVHVAHLSSVIEGASRPGHYRGVTTIVLKLFNIVKPDVALFGHKDAQQLVIVQHMVRDLNLDIQVVGVPTERDKTGLALSSRNVLLNDDQRRQATCLSRALKRVHFLVKKQGITHTGELVNAMTSAVNSAGEGVKFDYAKIVSRVSLEPLSHIEQGNTLVLIAAKIGNVRLIDSTRL